MTDRIFTVEREPTIPVHDAESYTPGVVYLDNVRFCFSCEDEDRFLENGNVEKVYGRTAIPRGKYKLTVSYSHHFSKELPEIVGVKTHTGVRCHGGNRAEHSLGCILIGQVRTSDGIAKCAETVHRMINIINATEDAGGTCWIEVK